MKLFASIGYFDDSGEGTLLEVDLAAAEARVVLSHTPPANLLVPGKGFTGMAWDTFEPGRTLFVCGFNSVYRVAVEEARVVGTLHRPDFNDLHGLSCHDGRLFIANTGLDAVEVMTTAGRFVGCQSLQPTWLNARRLNGDSPDRAQWGPLLNSEWAGQGPPTFEASSTRGAYYQDRPDGTPFHQTVVRDFVHPNHVDVCRGSAFVTAFRQRSIIDLATFEVVLSDLPGHPHDGRLVGELFWLTTVNGLVMGYDITATPWRLVERYDVFRKTRRTGWLRGLHVTTETIAIGLTEIRDMPRERWSDRPFEETRTGVVLLDRRTGRELSWVDLTDKDRHSKLFALVGVP
jgi:hypothetical protein